MALNWDHVERIRQAQSAAKDSDIVTDTNANMSAAKAPAGRAADVPRLDQYEALIFKIRAQLIDYIVAHGLVDGLIYDGTLRATESGKIVITKEMIDTVVDALGYYKAEDVLAYLEKYLPENFYVSDEFYVHTDNNFDDFDVDKLDSIEYGAEVNKIVDIIFNDESMLDPETRVATITITPEMIKEWYESNDDTNAFTDKAKAELEELWNRLDYLDAKVDDVLLDGETIVKNKIAYLTALKIKNSYESNPDTNAYTDAAKAIVESIPALRTRVELDEQRIDDLERTVVVLRNDLTEEIENRITSDNGLAQAHYVDVQRLTALINDNADSISELGDEVNRIGGEVAVLNDVVSNIVFEHIDPEPDSADYDKFHLNGSSSKVWGVRTDPDGNVTHALYTVTDEIESDTDDEYRVVNKKYVTEQISALPTGGGNKITYVPDGTFLGGTVPSAYGIDEIVVTGYNEPGLMHAHNMPVDVTPTINFTGGNGTIIGLTLRMYLSKDAVREYDESGTKYRTIIENDYYIDGMFSLGKNTTIIITDNGTSETYEMTGSRIMSTPRVGQLDYALHGSVMSRSFIDIPVTIILSDFVSEFSLEVTSASVEFIGRVIMTKPE